MGQVGRPGLNASGGDRLLEHRERSCLDKRPIADWEGFVPAKDQSASWAQLLQQACQRGDLGVVVEVGEDEISAQHQVEGSSGMASRMSWHTKSTPARSCARTR